MKFILSKILAIILFSLFLASMLLSVAGCGAKKSESQKKEEITNSEFSGIFRNSGNSFELLNSLSNINASSLSKIDDQNLTITRTKTFFPLNPALPASFIDENGKKYDLNNTSYTEETKTEKNNRKSENSQKSEEILKLGSEKKVNSQTDQVLKGKFKNKRLDEAKKNEQEEWQFPWWIWIIIAGLIFGFTSYLNKRFQWLKHVTIFLTGLFQFRKK